MIPNQGAVAQKGAISKCLGCRKKLALQSFSKCIKTLGKGAASIEKLKNNAPKSLNLSIALVYLEF